LEALPLRQRSRMNILHIIGSLSPRDGGPPEVTRQLAAAYEENGARMEVLCTDDPDAPFLKDFPCRVHGTNQRWLGRYCFSPRLWKWIHQNIGRFDAVVIQGIWTFPGIATRFAARKARKGYVVFPHGSLDPWFQKRYPFKHIKKLIYWPFQYPVLRDAIAVMFTSALEPGLAKLSFRPNEWNTVVFPQGIQLPKTDPLAQINAFYRVLPQLRNRRFFLFMSRLHTKKGCDLLMHAFAMVAHDYPDFDLVVAGPDQEGSQAKFQRICAEKGVADRVHWPGMIAGDVKWGALRTAEAFILPSHSENFGLVVAESLAAGRPVLTTNKVNIWRAISEDGAALIEDDTLEGIEQLFRRWLKMSDRERATMAARAFPCYASRFTLNQGAQTIKQLFLEPNTVPPGVSEVARTA
jgi:glycosyltransferase involved in cell wall biosynthesis